MEKKLLILPVFVKYLRVRGFLFVFVYFLAYGLCGGFWVPFLIYAETLPASLPDAINALLIFSAIGFGVIIFGYIVYAVWAGYYYRTLEFIITEKEVIFKQGVLFKKHTSIPIEWINDITIVHGPIMRHFKICTLHIHTSAVGLPIGEIVVSGVSLSDAENLRRELISKIKRPAELKKKEKMTIDDYLYEILSELRRIRVALEKKES